MSCVFLHCCRVGSSYDGDLSCFVDVEPPRQTQKRLRGDHASAYAEKLRPLFDIWKAAQPESEANVSAVQSNRIFTAGCNAMPGKMPGCGK
jgi:hypothetical protein